MSKCGNVRTTLYGIEFMSKLEGQRYLQLRDMEKHGEITNLQLQVPFRLSPDCVLDGKKHKGVVYIADFTYMTPDGCTTVEDAKGHRTEKYLLKRRLMKGLLDIEVVEWPPKEEVVRVKKLRKGLACGGVGRGTDLVARNISRRQGVRRVDDGNPVAPATKQRGGTRRARST